MRIIMPNSSNYAYYSCLIHIMIVLCLIHIIMKMVMPNSFYYAYAYA